MSETESPTSGKVPGVHSSSPVQASGLRAGWLRIMQSQIGVVPVPIFVLLCVVIAFFAKEGKVPNDLTMSIGILSVGGFIFMELGRRVAWVSAMGLAAILAFVVPSAMTYYGWIPHSVVTSVNIFTQVSNFLYLYIAAIIVGSILSMDRSVLVAGFLKIFVPLAAGSVVAMVVGTVAGVLTGHGAMQSLFYIVLPIMAGGLGEGAIPLSLGYSLISGQSQADLFAQVIPVVMLGSFMAVLLCGLLNVVGKRYPSLTGEGRLQPGVENLQVVKTEASERFDPYGLAAAAITIVCLYLIGTMGQKMFNFPAPITMLFLAVVLKVCRMIPASLENDGRHVYAFFARVVTYPLLFAMGIALTPWDKFVAAFTIPTVVTVFATVASLMGTAFVVARWVKMYPIDAAVVIGCHSGQGGTGDIAILTAANRMSLMPFAQISTRIGGAVTVTLALLAFRHLV